jgi:acetyl-CoA carboxylase biotin carboxylase subunit
MAEGWIFIANRGEIALRAIRTARALGLETVVGVSAADRNSLWADAADRALTLGPAPAQASYLDQRLVLHAAIASGCALLYPGYGFLSERADFAALCAAEGVRFVGPSAEQIGAVGDKIAARALAEDCGVPVNHGTAALADAEAAVRAAEAIGFPVLTKASAGGGGRGMVIAHNADQLGRGFAAASAAAEAAFGDGRLFLERYVARARHIEVQAFGLGDGRVLHLHERDCSVQRRYQKMVEEAPAAVLPADVRDRVHAAAVSLLGRIGYANAGTVEFLYDEATGSLSFLEVNARIQVEHPVSEAITGTDLVAWQIGLAMGRAPEVEQADIAARGHAIEVRILAEDPARAFAPSPGTITRWHPPEGPGIRVDSGFGAGSRVPPFYDSMVAKLIVHASDRPQAVALLADALSRFEVEGIATNIPFLRRLVAHPDFLANRVHTRWLEQTLMPEAKAA